MSICARNVVILEDLMLETAAYARETIEEHRDGDDLQELLTDDIIPKQIAYGAIKYSILKCGNEKT